MTTGLSRRSLLKSAGGMAIFAGMYGTLLASCSTIAVPAATGTQTTTPVKGGFLLEGATADAADWNALNIRGSSQEFLLAYVLECLYAPTPNGEFTTRLAAALPTPSSDGLSLTVPLRKSALWSDGQPLTADDVTFTYGLLLDPQYNAISSGWRSPVRARLDHVDATDPSTVVFTLKSPGPFLQQYGALIGILPKHIYAGKSAAEIQAMLLQAPPVVSGVWKIDEWVTGDHIKFVRNDNYYGGPALLDGILLKPIPDTNKIVNQLQTGELHVAKITSLGALNDLKALAGFETMVVPDETVLMYDYNQDPARPESKIFSSKAVRQALLYAVDRDGFKKAIFNDLVQPQDSSIIAQSWAYNSNPMHRYTFDQARAAQMLDAEGWKLGPSGIREKDGVQMRFEIPQSSSLQSFQDGPLILQQNWMKIGVEAIPRPYDIAGLSTASTQHEWGVQFHRVQTRVDPDQTEFYHSRNVGVGGTNSSSYVNPEVDKLFDQAVSLTDQEARKKIYFQIQDILSEDVPMAPVVSQAFLWTYSTKVHGLGPETIGPWSYFGPRPNMNQVFLTS